MTCLSKQIPKNLRCDGCDELYDSGFFCGTCSRWYDDYDDVLDEHISRWEDICDNCCHCWETDLPAKPGILEDDGDDDELPF